MAKKPRPPWRTLGAFICALSFLLLIPGPPCVGEGTVTISWTILPSQTLSEFPRSTAERSVLHPFELPRPVEDLAIHEGVVKLAVRSNVPWTVAARLDCGEGRPPLSGAYFLFGGEAIALGCEHIPLATGGLGEHLLVIEFTIVVPQEEIATGIPLEGTLIFEVFPSAPVE